MISLAILPVFVLTGFGTQIVPMTLFVALTAATIQTGLT